MTRLPNSYEIDDQTMQHYLRKGRMERSIAIHQAFRGLSQWIRCAFLNHFQRTNASGCGEPSAL